jgi:general nucleoside transport system permease protein
MISVERLRRYNPRVILFASALVSLLAYVLMDRSAPLVSWLFSPLMRAPRIGVLLNTYADVVLSGVAFFLAFRLRHFPLGAEASAAAGGFAAWFVAAAIPLRPELRLLLSLTMGAIAGAAVMLLAGYLKTRFRANEIVTTLMLVNIVPRLQQWLFPTLWALVAGLVTRTVGLPARFEGLPRVPEILGVGFGTLHAGCVISSVAALAALFVLVRSPLGYAINMTGASERFAHYGGIPVIPTVLGAYALIGALMALPGVYRAIGGFQDPGIQTPLLATHGIVIAVLARERLWRVPPIALAYAYALVITDLMGITASIGNEVLQIASALAILVVSIRVRQRAATEVTSP